MRVVRQWLLSLGLLVAITIPTRADTIVGLVGGTQLTTFDSATPGTNTPLVNITGLRANEVIVGIDFRPATPGVLVGVGRLSNSGFVYTIDVNTGAATAINTSGFAIPAGVLYGIDFNPVPNALRIIASDTSNLRITAGGTGTFNVDTALSQSGLVGAAYSNNFAGATTTTLYELDSINGNLVRQGGLNGPPSPNLGAITTVGSLGLSFSFREAGLDITAGGTAFASIAPANGGNSGLYTIDLSTGQATLLGAVGTPGIQDIAAVPSPTAVPAPAGGILLAIGMGVLAFRRRRTALTSTSSQLV